MWVSPARRPSSVVAGRYLMMFERKVRDVAARVRDPHDRREDEEEAAEPDQVPGQRQRDDRQRQRGRVDERQDARRRHVHLFAGGLYGGVLVLAHPTYRRAATK